MGWLKTLSLLLLGLVLLLVGALWWATGTESGARALVDLAQRLGDGRLKVGAVEGTLLDEIQLRDVAYAQPGLRLELARARLAWSPFELFDRILHLRALDLSGVRYVATGDAPPPEKEPSSASGLPELRLPVRIRVDRIEILDASARLAPDAEPLRLNSARLVANWDDRGIEIERLALDAPDGALRLTGRLDPVGDYPLAFENRIDLKRAGLPKLTLDGRIDGDLASLALKQRVSGDIDADLDATLSDLLGQLGWKTRVALRRLRPGQFSEAVPGVLSGHLAADGDLHHATAKGDLKLRAKDQPLYDWDARIDADLAFATLAARLRKLSLTRPDGPARLEASGRYDAKAMQLDAQWHALQWPLNGKPDVASEEGRIRVDGTPEDYRLELNARVAGRDIPNGDWRGNGHGDLERLHLDELVGDTLDGRLTLQGDVAWKPRVSWKMETRVAGVNPGVQFQEWPGKLSLQAHSEGELLDSGVRARLSLERFDGELRGLPVAGGGEIRIEPERYRFDGFHLRSGRARIEADGVLGGDSALRWKVAVPDLADLLPDAAGSLNGEGRLAGDFRQPRIVARIQARDLDLAGVAAGRVDADGDIDLSWQRPSRLNLNGERILANGQALARVDVDADGTLERHRLRLHADHELAKLDLDAAGGYLKQRWRGAVDRLDARSKRFGDWSLGAPMKIEAGADRARVERFCLKRDTGKLCADGQWITATKNGTGGFEAKGLVLAWLAPWLPAAIESVSGVLNARGKARFAGDVAHLRADVDAEVTPGRLVYQLEDKQGEVAHQGGKLRLRVADAGVDADLDLSLAENVAHARLAAPRLLAAGDALRSPLSGRVRLDARHFDIVPALAPMIETLDGAIDTDFTLHGTLARPELRGNGKIALRRLAVPDYGVELDDSRVDIRAEGRRLLVDGALRSRGGELKLDGEAVLDPERHWPAHLSLKGSRFRVVDLPDIRIDISPDLRVEREATKTLVEGQVKIDKADILLNELPEGARSPSDDIVVVRKGEPPQPPPSPSLPLYIKLDLILGKEVHFIGYGLNAFIDGRLRITALPNEPMKGSGEIRIEQGTFRAYGQNLDIQTGIVSFPGGPLTKPGINLRATRQIDNIVVGVSAIGPATKPRITTFSDPAMAERDVISYLLTGSPTSQIGKGAGMLSVGKQINSKLSVSVGTNPSTGDAEFKTNYRINRKIHLQATNGSKSNAFDIFYTIER